MGFPNIDDIFSHLIVSTGSITSTDENSAYFFTEGILNYLLASVALESAALSHIVNAEAEKLQYIAKYAEPGDNWATDDISDINESVELVSKGAADINCALSKKALYIFRYMDLLSLLSQSEMS
jgi:hypothetical protein